MTRSDVPTAAAVPDDVAYRLREVSKTLRSASGSSQAFAIDFAQLASDIDAALATRQPEPAEVEEALRELVDWLDGMQRHISGEFHMDELLAPARAALLSARQEEPVREDGIWGRWFLHNEAPRGSYACLYRPSEHEQVRLAWMPAEGRPNLPNALVMPFLMPGDKGDAR